LRQEGFVQMVLRQEGFVRGRLAQVHYLALQGDDGHRSVWVSVYRVFLFCVQQVEVQGVGCRVEARPGAPRRRRSPTPPGTPSARFRIYIYICIYIYMIHMIYIYIIIYIEIFMYIDR